MSTQALPATPGPKPLGVVDQLVAAAAGAREPRTVLVASVPAPVAPLEALLDAAPDDEAVVWAPPEGTVYAGIGAVATLTGSGEGRIAEIQRAATALFARVAVVAGDAPEPQCFGGFAFQAGGAKEAPWQDFGDARFVLPRFTYSRTGDRAHLAVAARIDELASEPRRRALAATADRLLAALRAAPRGPVSAPDRGERVIRARSEMSEADFSELVVSVRDLIRAGSYEKVVVARRTLLTFEAPVRETEVLAELAKHGDVCTRFAFRLGSTTFLGATPERLVRRAGLDVLTEALAGSNSPGGSAHGAELLTNAKERSEHEPVVREIVKCLAPLCSTLEHPPEPEVRILRHLIHLRTPVRGRLAAPVHVLELVERLHPTPAVGGVPREAAMQLIRDRERAERGWYAAPVGRFDARGEGEFVVGLRSGAIVGDEAYLYAGGGLVSDSDPKSEYEETRLKLATLAAALRVAQ